MSSNVKRAVLVGKQSAQGTAATTFTTLRYAETRSWMAGVKKVVRKYQRGVRWLKGDAVTTTRAPTVTLDVEIDTREFPLLLTGCSFHTVTGAGPYTHVFDFALSGLSWLTIVFWDGTTGEMWQLVDCRGNDLTLDLEYTDQGVYKGTITFMGITLTRLTSGLPALSIVALTNRDPLAPWMTPIYLDGEGTSSVCAISAKISYKNNLKNQYCSPSVDPTGATVPGLPPAEVMEGEASAELDLTARYLGGAGYAGSPFAHYLAGVDEAYELRSTKTAETPDHTFSILLPRFQALEGQITANPDDIGLRQNVKGDLLLDDTTATGMKITVVNDVATY